MTDCPHAPRTPSSTLLTGQTMRLLPAHPESSVIVPLSGAIHPSGDMVSGEQARAAVQQAARVEMIQRLSIPTEASDFFDEVATHMADRTGFLYGMVNLFLDEQTFIGLHNPPAASGYPAVDRTMSRDHGWCPEVIDRQKALPLPNVHAYHRFSSNRVVDAIGIQSYFGAPLIHDGVAVGTVCVIDPEPRPLAEAVRLRDLVNDTRQTVMKAITAHAPSR
ncbi:GAF domain-containing protein [Streptomyces sp. NPDC052036]|uniref:GAF domain-containing protein n=1 Tax=unclassified Streptomyces TaxID=2593676 RepID=UPI0034156E4C